MCLNFLILKFVEGHQHNKFDGLQINKQTPPIPIFCFADDCIIFCKTNDKYIQFITQTLQLFAQEDGLCICWKKSKILFSKNTPKKRTKEICNTLGVKHSTTTEKYLCLPLNMNRISKESFFDIVLKAQSKISNWYTRFLSYAGRYTLVNHVLNSLPQYTMNVHKIPNITINKLNSIAKKFLWNASTQSNKKSPLNWKTITYHKNKGGLRIRNLIILNKAYIMKNTWRLIHEKDSLWVKVMKGKYFPKTNLHNSPQPKPYHSCIQIFLNNQNSLMKLPSGHLVMVNP